VLTDCVKNVVRAAEYERAHLGKLLVGNCLRFYGRRLKMRSRTARGSQRCDGCPAIVGGGPSDDTHATPRSPLALIVCGVVLAAASGVFAADDVRFVTSRGRRRSARRRS
jgi:hypothetical protein